MLRVARILLAETEPSHRICEALWSAWSYLKATRRLQSIKEKGSKPSSSREEANLQAMVDTLGRAPINQESNEDLRKELLVFAGKNLTSRQRQRIRDHRWSAWTSSGEKLQNLMEEDLSQRLQSLLTGSSPTVKVSYVDNGWLKVAIDVELSQCYCPNSDCDDFNKKGFGNLTKEFAYGVNMDRHMLYCTTCKHRFSETRCTEVFESKLTSSDLGRILELAGDGLSMREIGDSLNLDKDSVNRAVIHARELCESMMKDYDTPSEGHLDDLLNELGLSDKHRGQVSHFITDYVELFERGELPSQLDKESDDKADDKDKD